MYSKTSLFFPHLHLLLTPSVLLRLFDALVLSFFFFFVDRYYGRFQVKARSATGLAHAVENRSRLVLDIQIQPATIYISEGGVYDSNKPTLLADLGLLSITTVESDPVSAFFCWNFISFFF